MNVGDPADPHDPYANPELLTTTALLKEFGQRMPDFYTFPGSRFANFIFIKLTFEEIDSWGEGECSVPAVVDTGCSSSLVLPRNWMRTVRDENRKGITPMGNEVPFGTATVRIRLPNSMCARALQLSDARTLEIQECNAFSFIVGLRLLGERYEIHRDRRRVSIICHS